MVRFGLMYYFIIGLLHLLNQILCNESSENKFHKYVNESAEEETLELITEANTMVWSEFLEDYVLSKRHGKDMPYVGDVNGSGSQKFAIMINSNAQQPMNYHSSVYKRPSVIINKRIGDAGMELEPHKRPPPAQPQFRPMVQQQPGLLQQLFGLGNQQQLPPPMRPPHSNMHSNHQPIRSVTENDLYLLGAIEKLVYRVDYLESRLRRAEQLIYYLMAGNNQKEVIRDPCPTNFSRINDNCYYINSYQQVNWKTANSACKALNSHLVEFEGNSENEDIIAYLLNQPQYRGRDYWLGALNPGLLWIWSNSAKPVNPNTNLTSMAMSHPHKSSTTETETNVIETDGVVADKTQDKDSSNAGEIKGDGRCLRLTYNTSRHSFDYYGEECTSRHHFICEYEDKTLANKIKKITRDLKL